MPYKDPKKKKAYYENHIKAHQKQYISDNREAWNTYQKRYKVRKRFKQVEYLRNLIVDENLAERGTKVFEAILVFLHMLDTGVYKTHAIAYRLVLHYKVVDEFKTNWSNAGMWDEKKKHFYLEEGSDDRFEFTMMGLIGAGKVCVATVTNK